MQTMAHRGPRAARGVPDWRETQAQQHSASVSDHRDQPLFCAVNKALLAVL